MGVEPIIDSDSAPFWNALRNGELRLQRCTACGCLRYPPGPLCRSCGEPEAEWVEVSGRGRVLSWTTTHVAYDQSVQDLPYSVVVVELEEQPGVLLHGNLSASDAVPRYLMPVEAVITDPGDGGQALVLWREA